MKSPVWLGGMPILIVIAHFFGGNNSSYILVMAPLGSQKVLCQAWRPTTTPGGPRPNHVQVMNPKSHLRSLTGILTFPYISSRWKQLVFLGGTICNNWMIMNYHYHYHYHSLSFIIWPPGVTGKIRKWWKYKDPGCIMASHGRHCARRRQAPFSQLELAFPEPHCVVNVALRSSESNPDWLGIHCV
jgi:hypothetical protein